MANFSSLDVVARERQIPLITGASTVPGLSSAIIDATLGKFSQLQAIDYGIGAGLKTGLGLATLQSVLGSCGKPYEILNNGKPTITHGLSRPRPHDFSPPVNRRFIVDCDIPDHSLFQIHYPTLRQMDFGSGIDLPGLAQILALMSDGVRDGWVANWNFLSNFTEPIMNVVRHSGSPHSGYFMDFAGQNHQGKPKKMLLEILACDGSGLEIPVTPVVLLVKRMLKRQSLPAGACPCMGLFSLAEFQQELSSYPISWNWKDIQ